MGLFKYLFGPKSSEWCNEQLTKALIRYKRIWQDIENVKGRSSVSAHSISRVTKENFELRKIKSDIIYPLLAQMKKYNYEISDFNKNLLKKFEIEH